MLFQITEIEFDLDDAIPEFLEHPFINPNDEIIGQIWEADDQDDLVEEITCATGWCIKSINYRHILEDND